MKMFVSLTVLVSLGELMYISAWVSATSSSESPPKGSHRHISRNTKLADAVSDANTKKMGRKRTPRVSHRTLCSTFGIFVGRLDEVD